MKILLNTRRAFSFAGYLTKERIFTFKFGHEIASSLIILSLILIEVGSIVYVLRHLKIGDYQNCLYGSLQIAGVLPVIAIFVAMMYHKDRVHDVIGGFQKIFDQCNGDGFAIEYPESDRF